MMFIYTIVCTLKKFFERESPDSSQSVKTLKDYIGEFYEENFFSEEKVLKLLAQKYLNQKKQNTSLTPIYISSFSINKCFVEVLLDFINASGRTIVSLADISPEERLDYENKLKTALVKEFKESGISDDDGWLANLDSLQSLADQQNEKIDIENNKCLEFLLRIKKYIQTIDDRAFRQNFERTLAFNEMLIELLKERLFSTFKLLKEKLDVLISEEISVLDGINNEKHKQALKVFIEKCKLLNSLLADSNGLRDCSSYFAFVSAQKFSSFFATLTDVVKTYKKIGFIGELFDQNSPIKDALLAPKIYFENFFHEFDGLINISEFSQKNAVLVATVKQIGKTQVKLLEYGKLFSTSCIPKPNYFVANSALILPAEPIKLDTIILHNLLRIYNYYANTPLAEKELREFGKNNKTGWILPLEKLINECVQCSWQAGSDDEPKFNYLNKIFATISEIESHTISGGKNSRLVGTLKELYNTYASNESHFPIDNQLPKLPNGLLLQRTDTKETNNFLRKNMVDFALQQVYGYQRRIERRSFDNTLYLKKKKTKEIIGFLTALYEEDEEQFERRILTSFGRVNNVYDVIVDGLSELLQECGHIPSFYFEDQFYETLDQINIFLNKIKPISSKKSTFELLNKPRTAQFVSLSHDISIELAHEKPNTMTEINKAKVLFAISNILRVCDVYNATDLGKGVVIRYQLEQKKSKGNWRSQICRLAQNAMQLYLQLLSGENITPDRVKNMLDEAIEKIQSKKTFFIKGSKLINSFNYVKSLISSENISVYGELIGGKPFFMSTLNSREAEDYIQRHILETLIAKISGYQTNYLNFFSAPKISQKSCYQLLSELNELFAMDLAERQSKMQGLGFMQYLEKTLNALGKMPGLTQEQQLGEVFSRYLDDAKSYLKTINIPVNNI